MIILYLLLAGPEGSCGIFDCGSALYTALRVYY